MTPVLGRLKFHNLSGSGDNGAVICSRYRIFEKLRVQQS